MWDSGISPVPAEPEDIKCVVCLEWCAHIMFYDAGMENPTCPECVWTHFGPHEERMGLWT